MMAILFRKELEVDVLMELNKAFEKSVVRDVGDVTAVEDRVDDSGIAQTEQSQC